MAAVGLVNRSLLDPLPTHPRRMGKKNRNIETKRNIHFKSLDKFFSQEKNFDILFGIVNQHSLLSLRMLEFICTTLASGGLVIKRSDNGNDVYLEAVYQDQMGSQGKQFFDPFRRKPESKFMMKRFSKKVITNIAQLRFFRFAIRFGVIEYANKNFRDVETLMSESTAKRKLTDPRGRGGSKRKRARAHVHTENVNLSFSPAHKKLKAIPM